MRGGDGGVAGADEREPVTTKDTKDTKDENPRTERNNYGTDD